METNLDDLDDLGLTEERRATAQAITELRGARGSRPKSDAIEAWQATRAEAAKRLGEGEELSGYVYRLSRSGGTHQFPDAGLVALAWATSDEADAIVRGGIAAARVGPHEVFSSDIAPEAYVVQLGVLTARADAIAKEQRRRAALAKVVAAEEELAELT